MHNSSDQHLCKAPDCGKPDTDKPMCFVGEDWCSDDHRKIVQNSTN